MSIHSIYFYGEIRKKYQYFLGLEKIPYLKLCKTSMLWNVESISGTQHVIFKNKLSE